MRPGRARPSTTRVPTRTLLHEPRLCPRGGSFSWCTYSPVRLGDTYIWASLLERWRAGRATAGDPLAAFAEVAADGGYRDERGGGGFVRCDGTRPVS